MRLGAGLLVWERRSALRGGSVGEGGDRDCLSSTSADPASLPLSLAVGTVNKIAADYISLVVLGFVNTSVGAAQVRSELRPRLGEGRWASTKDAAHAIEVGTDVAFRLQG